MAILLPLVLVAVIASSGWRTGYFTLALLMLIPWPFVFSGPKKREQPVRKAAATGGGDSALRPVQVAGVVEGGPFLRRCSGRRVSAGRAHGAADERQGADPGCRGAHRLDSRLRVLAGRLLTGYLIDRFFAPFVIAALFIGTAAGCMVLLYGGPGVAIFAAALIGISLGAEATSSPT